MVLLWMLIFIITITLKDLQGIQLSNLNSKLYTNRLSHKNDSLINNISIECNQSIDLQRVHCVNKIFNNIYTYNVTNITYYPEELLNNSADCSSSALFYKMALNKVNISNDVINTNNHVFNVANLEYGYCIIDQQLVKCTNTVTLER